MFMCLQKNLILFLFSTMCLTLAAVCQLLIPSIVAKGLTALSSGAFSTNLYLVLTTIFLAKLAMQTLGNSMAALMEAKSRFLLINFVVHDKRPYPLNFRVTMIKEDAEKIASVLHDSTHLAGSCILTFATAYILLRENAYFFIPLILITALTCVQLIYAKPKIQSLYKAEMVNEDLYKESLISTFSSPTIDDQNSQALITSCNERLKNTIRARYKYQKANAIQCFWPEMAISAGTVSVVIFSATATPELFGERLIACLGYVGIFTMASTSSIRLGITMIGVRVSVSRIFGEHQYE